MAAQRAPDFRSISRFRERYLAALVNVFLQALDLCRAAGMVKLGLVALDGTKVRANASRHKVMSYALLGAKQKVLAEEISDLIHEANTVCPPEKARAAVESKARARGDDDDDINARGDTAAAAAVPKPTAQRNFTDPDARIMKTADSHPDASSAEQRPPARHS